MPRKLLTEVFPFLLPLRLWQRKKLYYMKMRFDENRYAQDVAPRYANTLIEDKSLLINENTGASLEYQYNKVHNLRLAARTVNRIVIRPGETFSLWWLVRCADRKTPYKDGLCVHNGRLTHVYGGGLCQLSNQLFWLFLHTPLTIVERHKHKIKEFPNPSPDDPCGVDATILEGWLDLRARNDTQENLQILLSMDEEYFSGAILTERPIRRRYDIVNRNLKYYAEAGKQYESVEVVRRTLDAVTGEVLKEEALYTNVTEIGYAL